MDERWKAIPGYEGRYEVSDHGRIKSLNFRGCTGKEEILKKRLKKDGYFEVAIFDKGKQKYFRVHRIVAMAFIPNPEQKPEVNHLNGIKTDNRVENLEWCTSSENQKHAYRTGLQPPTSEKQREARQKNALVAAATNIGRKASKETREKISASRKGKKHSAEWVENWKKSMMKHWGEQKS